MTNNKKFFFAAVIIVLLLVATAIILLSKKSLNPLKDFANYQSQEQELLAKNNTALAAANTNSGKIPAFSDNDFIVGSASAPLKVIVYESLADNFSAELNKTLNQAQAEFAEKIALVIRPFFFNGDIDANRNWQIVACANEQKAFASTRELILTNLAKDNNYKPDLKDLSAKLNLDEKALNQCLTAGKYQAKIAGAIKAVKNQTIFGAPTLIIGKEIITGARAFEETKSSTGEKLSGLKDIIQRNLK